VLESIISGRRVLPPKEDLAYVAFVDMSGGSSDDATLSVAHREAGRTVIDLVTCQDGGHPFNPRNAVRKFAGILKQYGLRVVTGDNYAGLTYKYDFEAEGITYKSSLLTKTELYEALEPAINAGEVELPDVPKLLEQLLTLVVRGARVDHMPGDHDDFANAVAGAAVLAGKKLLDEVPCVLPFIATAPSYFRNFDTGVVVGEMFSNASAPPGGWPSAENQARRAKIPLSTLVEKP
jgi:hypothetical protein